MSLRDYRKKRHFEVTSEPKGKKGKAQDYTYVIHKHDASHLHYDLRLALNGVLKSWAVPKGPSLNPKEKRLAVEVEDHPLDYANFEGVIPEGEYGAGPSMLWDEGTWEPLEDPSVSYQKGKIVFLLLGKKLKGKWILVRTKAKGSKPAWLLIKSQDEYANTLSDQLLLESNSVKTGKSMDELRGNSQVKSKSLTLPKTFQPELATSVKSVPTEPGWLFEIKFDGYRLLAFVENGKARLITRNGNDWTCKFPRVVAELEQLPIQNAIIDGELVALDKKGVSRFQLLQNAILHADKVDLYYYLFDLPFLNGEDLSAIPLIDRKAKLKSILSEKTGFLRYSEHLTGHAQDIFSQACGMAVEGLVAKRAQSAYQQKRTEDWIKIKCMQRQEFVICGYTDPKGARQYFGSLLLGYYTKEQQLRYAGRVGTGFNLQSLKAIYQQLIKHQANKAPFSDPRTIPDLRATHWLKPMLVAEIEFSEWTDDGRIRHPSFKGLREDKGANEVHAELPLEITKAKPIKAKQAQHGIEFTHLDKVLFLEPKITKGQLIEYYQKHIDLILPHLLNRPLSVLRCPSGIESCFYQKHADSQSANLSSIEVQEKQAVRQHLVIRNESDLLQLLQLGTLEFHTWGCCADDLERPNRMVFDLDPGPNVPFSAIVEAAQVLKVELQALGLRSFVKTSGKKGLHVFVPLLPVHSWDEAKGFAKKMAEHMVSLAPDRYIATMSKAKRSHKILIDYWRNERGATCVSTYSTRATNMASISTPIDWDALASLKNASLYHINNISAYLAKCSQDPWRNYFSVKQKLDLRFTEK